MDGVSFQIAAAGIFAFVGPNGGGKTTLFRLLSTLIPIQQGDVSILGCRLPHEVQQVRRQIGVVFQAASIDKKLTVEENLKHQGHLYGLRGVVLRERIDTMLASLSLGDRRRERCERLSGGLRRRVELAKGMLHRPRLLLLDEPSNALDPAARGDLWRYLEAIRSQGVTVVMTTHLLEEADKADQMAILHQGRIVALDTPQALRGTIGGDAVTIDCVQPEQLAAEIAARFDTRPLVVDGQIRLEEPGGHQWVTKLVEAFPGRIDSITFARPTLEDVFIAKTGHRYHADVNPNNSEQAAGASTAEAAHV